MTGRICTCCSASDPNKCSQPEMKNEKAKAMGKNIAYGDMTQSAFAGNVSSQNVFSGGLITDKRTTTNALEALEDLYVFVGVDFDFNDTEAAQWVRTHYHTIRQALTPQWEPIETAPRDGTQFLAKEGNDYYGCSFDYEDDDGRIIWTVYCGQHVTLGAEPTHWKPLDLTTPPKEKT